MSAWWILTIILTIATIVFAVLANRERGIIFAISVFFTIMSATTSMIIAVAFPLMAKKDILIFEATKTTLTLTESFMDDAVVSEMIENANSWLTHAKADIRTYGVFSKYYKSGVDELDYITID
jgi:hypothetical protein